MKLSVALLTAAAAVAAAQPHQHHQHAHLHKREASPAEYTEVVYILNGSPISAADVQAGIANGTLVFGPGGSLVTAPLLSQGEDSKLHIDAAVDAAAKLNVNANANAAVSVSSSSTAVVAAPATSAPAASSSAASSSSSSSAKAASSPASADISLNLNANVNVNVGGAIDTSFASDTTTGVNTPFPDGELSCSTFPSNYGAVPVDYMGLGGWTGVQTPGDVLATAFNDIVTAIFGGRCTEGSFCSYACPAGYQKSQWPANQGATGQSVGGIQCRNGKLHLTNPSLSKNLCMTGTTEVTVLVKNTLSSNVAVCRTDYPGTESETIPLNTQPGTVSNLTCPDAANYYKWEGASTSAQYYLNPAGVAVSDACSWGSAANPWGNFAPLNLGVGYSNGAAWLSIFQNLPTTSATLPFTVELVGDNLSGRCRYKNGQYCSGPNYETCSATTGCTVSLTSGTAYYVLS